MENNGKLKKLAGAMLIGSAALLNSGCDVRIEINPSQRQQNSAGVQMQGTLEINTQHKPVGFEGETEPNANPVDVRGYQRQSPIYRQQSPEQERQY